MQIDNLENKILVSPIHFNSSHSEQFVIYICFQNENGQYIGFYINKSLGLVNVNSKIMSGDIQINFGGIHSIDNYFILHSNEYKSHNTISVDENISLTNDNNFLTYYGSKLMRNCLIIMGYSIWSKENIEHKIRHEHWICMDVNPNIVFNQNNDSKWTEAVSMLNVDPITLSIAFANA